MMLVILANEITKIVVLIHVVEKTLKICIVCESERLQLLKESVAVQLEPQRPSIVNL